MKMSLIVMAFFLVAAATQAHAARPMLQASTGDATLLLSRVPSRSGARCSGAIVVSVNGQVVGAGVSVTYELNGVQATRATTATGRVLVVSANMPAGTPQTCTLRVISAASQAGAPLTLTAGALRTRTLPAQ